MAPSVNGYSQCVTASCVEMSTAYTNSIVECFEARLKAYIVLPWNIIGIDSFSMVGVGSASLKACFLLNWLRVWHS